MLTYLNFDLVFERADQGYRVEASGPDGRHATSFQVPTTPTELENLVLRIGRTRHAMRRIDPPEIEAAKRFGERLFDAIFKDEVGTTFRRSLAQADEQQAGLRVRVRLTRTPELANLPWEYLYDRDVNRFLALSTETPLVRFLDIPERIRPLAVQLPLRALAIIANPRGQVPLHVEREWANIQTALGDLVLRGALELERLDRPTMSALQRRLRQKSYHILHFIGHGAFEQRLQDGVLMLEDVQGDEYRVSGQEIGMLLHDHRSLRMVLLNVCEGGRSASDDPFAGVAQSLVQQGVPAVIAMQFEVSDEAAIALAHEFYSAVTDGYPVDAALAEARKSVFAQGYRLEWGTPVLYLRSHDGQIFETGASSPGAAPPASQAMRQAEQAYTEALALFYTRQWQAATTAFERVLQLDPDHADASAKLKQARREQELAGRYAAAQQAIEAQQWAQALTELNAVAAIDPDYHDVEALARSAQRHKQLAELGGEALALFRAQSWQAVLNVVDRMRTVDPEIGEYDEIAETSRQKLLEQEQSERVAALYNDGLALMRDGQWPQALECFEEIERRVPGYQQTPALLQRVREELGTPAAVVTVEAPTPQETRAMSLRARLAAHYLGSMLFSIVLNIGLGHAMWSLGRVPLYLDTLGTIIVGFMFGPWVGFVSGLVSHFVWSTLGLESGTFAGSFAFLVGLV
ncbi:MAG TPA: CHAT domain-containing protein, partial [Roseiflexaceae bacterium]|nr:CHAT domain-containing protein [Roseiflexaceae bacterium]